MQNISSCSTPKFSRTFWARNLRKLVSILELSVAYWFHWNSCASSIEFCRNTTKLAMLAFLYCFENKWDTRIIFNDFSFTLKHHDKWKFWLKLIQLVTISNLFSFKLVQKYILPTLRIMKNSNDCNQERNRSSSVICRELVDVKFVS